MAQTPKERVRSGFVAAAGAAFAERGYEGTSMADVADRAGSSVGNLYKYFPSKDALLKAVVPPELVAELRRLTRARIVALGAAKDVRELAEGARYHAIAGELLDYCLAHRTAVVIVMVRAEGTPYAPFAADFAEHLVRWALDYAGAAYPRLRATPALRWLLGEVYESFIARLAEALQRFPSDAEARSVIALITAHHQGGLKHLFETAGGTDAEPSCPQTPPITHPAPQPGAGDSGPRATGPKPARRRARPADSGGRPGRRR